PLLNEKGMKSWGAAVRDRARKMTGLPVSVGIAETKTLAKLASSRAKKRGGVFLLKEADREQILRETPIIHVWGIGPRKARSMMNRGILDALSLIKKEDAWIKENFTIVTLRTVWELRGIPSIKDEPEGQRKKEILSSLGFNKPVTDRNIVKQAVSLYTETATRKLMAQNSYASIVSVFINTNRFKEDFYSNTATVKLERPSNYLPELNRAALHCFEKIYKPGNRYIKAGVFLSGLEDVVQQDLFSDRELTEKQEAMMHTVQMLNNRYGSRTLTSLSTLGAEGWKMKRDILSPSYTTRWEDLPICR
ncbi:MAG: DUF4113 domain-containing protein, partial [Spirochaetales bacterium]|nr:DUF4113 domain-containing protein [Spirochaetales bacterium]